MAAGECRTLCKAPLSIERLLNHPSEAFLASEPPVSRQQSSCRAPSPRFEGFKGVLSQNMVLPCSEVWGLGHQPNRDQTQTCSWTRALSLSPPGHLLHGDSQREAVLPPMGTDTLGGYFPTGRSGFSLLYNKPSHCKTKQKHSCNLTSCSGRARRLRIAQPHPAAPNAPHGPRGLPPSIQHPRNGKGTPPGHGTKGPEPKAGSGRGEGCTNSAIGTP